MAIKPGPDFGGLWSFRRVGPGESTEVSADLRAWVDLDRPGRYAVTATHETDLAKGAATSSYPENGADVWTITPTGQGEVTVQ